jgi:hypothetical protein
MNKQSIRIFAKKLSTQFTRNGKTHKQATTERILMKSKLKYFELSSNLIQFLSFRVLVQMVARTFAGKIKSQQIDT